MIVYLKTPYLLESISDKMVRTIWVFMQLHLFYMDKTLYFNFVSLSDILILTNHD